jgi:hypothetical protein
MHCREVVDTCARRTLEFGVNAVAPCNATNATIVIAFIIVDGIIRRIVAMVVRVTTKYSYRGLSVECIYLQSTYFSAD